MNDKQVACRKDRFGADIEKHTDVTVSNVFFFDTFNIINDICVIVSFLLLVGSIETGNGL